MIFKLCTSTNLIPPSFFYLEEKQNVFLFPYSLSLVHFPSPSVTSKILAGLQYVNLAKTINKVYSFLALTDGCQTCTEMELNT